MEQVDVREYYNNLLPYFQRDDVQCNSRYQMVFEALRNIVKRGDSVLDLGCGTGITSRFMSNLEANVTAVDFAESLVSFGKRYCPGVDFIVGDVTNISLKKKFDVITIVDLLEHLSRNDIDKFLRVIDEHLNEDGRVYLNIPDGRFAEYIRTNHPHKTQIIDESHSITSILDMFKDIEMEVQEMRLYGLDVPGPQYNEYLFVRDSKFRESIKLGG